MGLGGISLWQLLIVLLIVILIFGTKRMRTIGTDLGGALKGFRKAMSDGEEEAGKDSEKLDEPDADFVDNRAEEQQADRNRTS
jgi:sec-independent protein translocase protein TatA